MTKKRLIDAYRLEKLVENHRASYSHRDDILAAIAAQPTVDAVEVPDKELLKAIKLLIKQYEHSKNSEYVHSPVAHALFHTWKQVDERRKDDE